MSLDAPLTYGQLSTWRSIETFAPERLMEVNVPAVWTVRGADTARILDTLRRLAARHESLRTTYHLVDGQPVQRVHETLEPRVTLVEHPAGQSIDTDAALRQAHARIFPVVGDPGWHGVLVAVGGAPDHLALAFSHLVVDVWAVRGLETEFHALLADPAAKPAGPAPSPRELALLQRSDAWDSRRRGAAGYWRKVIDAGPVRNLPEPPERDVERRIQATVRSDRLGQLLGHVAKAHGVSPQSVLTAMTAAGLAHLLDRDRVMLSVMCSNRFDPVWQPIVSTMNQLIPLQLEAPAEATLGAFLKRANIKALLSYRHGCYDVDEAAEQIAQRRAPDGRSLEHDCWFNYVSEPDDAPAAAAAAPAPDAIAGRPATLAWEPPPRHAGHPFYVRVNGDARTWLSVSLRTDPDLIGPAALLGVLRTIVLGVQRLATEPDSTLGALRADRDSAPLDPELFPGRADQATVTVTSQESGAI